MFWRRLISAFSCFLLLFQSSVPLALAVDPYSRNIDSATVNGGSSVTVNPNNSVTAAINVTLSGGATWLSTSYQITTSPVGTSYTCLDTPDYNTDGTYTETFVLTAPANVNSYNVFFRISGNDCSNAGSAVSNVYTLTNGIIVEADTVAPACPAPIFSDFVRTHYITGNTIYYSPITGSGTGSFKTTISPSDDGSGIQKVNFPAMITTPASDDSSAPYEKTYSWFDVSTFSGSGNITCYDNAGNTATSAFNVIKDATPPTFTSVTLDDYFVKDGETINITTDAADAGSGIGYCHAFWSTDTVWGSDTDLGDLGTDCAGSITVPDGAGTFYLIVRVGDNIGYYPNPIASGAIIVDNQNPLTTIASGDGPLTAVSSHTVNLSAEDFGGAGIADTLYCIGEAGDAGMCNPNISGLVAEVTCPGEATCTKLVYYRSLDNAGNLEPTQYSHSITIINDVTAPVTTASGCNAGWNYTDQTISFSCSDDISGCASTEYQVNGGEIWQTGSSVSLTEDGNYSVGFRSTDAAGNIEADQTTTCDIDKSVPVNVLIVSPLDNSLVKGLITVTASAEDVLSGLQKLEFWHASVGTEFGEDNSAPFASDLDTTELFDGLHQVWAKAYDLAGNSADSSPINLNIDNTAPVIADYADIATANDPGDSGAVVSYAPTAVDANDGPVSVVCTPASDSFLPLGDTTVTCQADDQAGNSTTVSFIVTVTDTEAPSAPAITASSHTLSTWSSDRTIDISWSAADNDGIAGYSYAWNQNPAANPDKIAEGVGTSATSPNRATSQSHYFHVRAVDNAGNWGTTTHSGPYWIDAANPLGSWLSPLDNAYLSGLVSLEATASDTGSGINFVRFRYQPSGSSLTTIFTDSADPYQADWDTTALTDGLYLLRLRIEDLVARNLLRDINVTLDNTQPDEPTASPVAGDYMADQSVTLASADAGSGLDKIYYTLDGVDPDRFATEYTAPILVDQSLTLKAIAYDTVGNSSSILTAVYGIAPVISGETSSSVGETSATITWDTDDLSTSRVIYDIVSHPVLGIAPNYDYANSTVEDPALVTDHSVAVTGLSAGTTYYYRTVSHGSPESVGDEQTFATTAAASSSTSSSSAGTGGASAGDASVCNDQKPGSAPVLLSAAAGSNSVTLTWSKASDPVTYYLVAYGTESGTPLFGNPNVGSNNTTSYTVTNLSGGTTYYFKVRAGNNCAPGEFSNELSAAPSGGFVTGPAAGFAAGVLGVKDQEADEYLPSLTDEQLNVLGKAETKSGSTWWLGLIAAAIGFGLIVFTLRRRH